MNDVTYQEQSRLIASAQVKTSSLSKTVILKFNLITEYLSWGSGQSLLNFRLCQGKSVTKTKNQRLAKTVLSESSLLNP